ncbi:aldehyde dehydrogenase [Nocardia sp. CA-151230]|uniref:aldehyde dehydrogenase n=1 Tax=Nocardia sp. CA-151230 TaxID=3239982 RepID=UPI003D8AE6D6
MEHVYDRLYLDGDWIESSGDAVITVVSAATEEPIGQVPEAVAADVDRAVAAARRAFDDPLGWSAWEPKDRAAVMRRFAEEIEERSTDFVRRVSMQNGMPVVVGAQTEGTYPAKLLHYYADLIELMPLEQSRRSMVSGTTLVRRAPLGVVAAVVPWNFPQSLLMFKLAPALAAGCTLVVKPAPETVLDAFLLAEAAQAAGIPAGVLNIVTGGRDLGAYLVGHRGVDKVAFTGSVAAGQAIAEQCGRLLRPVTLELGGKSAGIVLDDVDLGAAVREWYGAFLLNQGQTCYISTRILAPESRYDEILDALGALAGRLRIGDPLDPKTLIGPLVSQRQRGRVESYIAAGIAAGGRVVAGGGRPPHLDRGWYVQPTVFAGLDNDSVLAQEEIFGPVLTVLRYRDVDEAVRLANDSDFGLGGTVWTSDPQRGLDIARRVRTGSFGVNGFTLDPGAPFGGVKHSGLGRELGPEGLAAYHHLQSIYFPTGPGESA